MNEWPGEEYENWSTEEYHAPIYRSLAFAGLVVLGCSFVVWLLLR